MKLIILRRVKMVRTREKNARKKNCEEGEGSIRKPRKRWLDDVKNDLKKTNVRGWRKIAKGRDSWKTVRGKDKIA
jgi:hypothetical protein